MKNTFKKKLRNLTIKISFVYFIVILFTSNGFAQVETIDDNSFVNTIFDNEYVLIDFYATWCPPCKTVAPIIEDLSFEYGGLKFCKLDVDDNPVASYIFEIQSIPTILIFKNGEIIEEIKGARSKYEYKEIFSENNIPNY